MADYDKERNEVVNFPAFDQVPETEKRKPSYSISVSRAVYSKYKNNKTTIGHNWINFFDELREYGLGRQNPDKYKRFLTGATNDSADVLDGTASEDTREATRKGWWTVNWANVATILPNLRSVVRGSVADIDWAIKADAIDTDSGAIQETKMLQVYVGTHPVLGRMVNDLKQSANIPIQEPEFLPEGMEELEEMKDDGIFKEPYIQAHEKLLQHTENISDWDRLLKDQLLSDILDLGYAFCWTEWDAERCVPIWKYADPQRVIMQWDNDNLFRNSDYAGYIELWSISKLKQFRDHIFHKDGHKITEEEFQQIAKKACNRNGNPDGSNWGTYANRTAVGYGYDNFKMDVLRTWWIDTETVKRIKYTNRYGKPRIYDYKEPIEQEYDVAQGDNAFNYPYDMGNNYSLQVDPLDGTKIAKKTKRSNGVDISANNPGKVKVKAYINIGKDEQLKEVRLRKLYECQWIIDTDFCVKYGVAENQPRYRYAEPLLPLVGYKYPEKSLVYRSIGVADMYAIAFYRLQNALAKASQGVYAINTSLLGDNGKKLDPLKVLKAMRENQVLFYKMGLNNVGGTPVPLSYIPGNLAEAIMNEAQIMSLCLKWLEDQTGFSMMALGGTPNPEQPVGTAEMSLNTTNKTLIPITNALRYLKEEMGKRSSAMWQKILTVDEKARAEAEKIIGEDGVFILQQAKSISTEYGISMQARPDQRMKDNVLIAAQKASQAGHITVDEELYIVEQITSNANPREIRVKLRKMIQKNRQQEEMYKQQAIMLQSQQIKEQASVQAQSQERMQKLEIGAKDAELRTQGQTDIVVRQHDSDMKIREMKVQADLDKNNAPKP